MKVIILIRDRNLTYSDITRSKSPGRSCQQTVLSHGNKRNHPFSNGNLAKPNPYFLDYFVSFDSAQYLVFWALSNVLFFSKVKAAKPNTVGNVQSHFGFIVVCGCRDKNQKRVKSEKVFKPSCPLIMLRGENPTPSNSFPKGTPSNSEKIICMHVCVKGLQR